MKNRQNTFMHIVISNLKYYKFRTFVVATIITIITVIYILSKVCVSSFESGVENVTEKMGADIIIAPNNCTKEMKKALFTGEPSTITFNKELIKDIHKVSGVKKVSSQLLLATLNSSCCSEELQLIAFNAQDDFVVKTWDSNFKGNIDNYEMIIGSNVNYEVGATVTFYGNQFKVVGKLKETGMGYDRSVFINETTGKNLMTGIKQKQDANDISMVLIDVEGGTDVEKLCKEINKKIEGNGLTAYKSNEMYSDVVNGIENISKFINAFEYIVIFISILSIFTMFTLTIDERRREFATYEIIGVTDLMKGIIILLEAIITCILGALVGIALSILFIKFFSPYMEMKFQMPFCIPTIKEFGIYSIKGLIMAVLFGSISSCYSVFIVSQSNYNKLKEGR